MNRTVTIVQNTIPVLTLVGARSVTVEGMDAHQLSTI